MKKTNAIVPGSLAAIAKRDGATLAESFIGAEVVVIADTSGSMSARDSRGGKSRYDVLREELQTLQRENPGKLAVIAFSDDVSFCPGGEPFFYGGGTALHKALKFARAADIEGVRFVVISDGEPDNRQAAIGEARHYQGKISCVYVGPENRSSGRDFLAQLAAAAGGDFATADRVVQLADKVRPMLTEMV